jgi:hypothetical protein
MPPAILIIETRREVANALEEVVGSANYLPVVRPFVDQLSDVGITPAAIILRVSFDGVSEPPHAAVARWGTHRPPIIAIVWSEEESAAAQRLKCEVILRAPNDVSHLCEALERLVHA